MWPKLRPPDAHAVKLAQKSVIASEAKQSPNGYIKGLEIASSLRSSQ